MAAETEMPLMVCGAVALQVQLAGHVTVPELFSSPVLFTDNATPGTSMDQIKLRFGCARPAAQLERATLKVATHELARLGADTSVTTTPDCGLATVKLKLLMLVTPPAILVAIEIGLWVLAVPPQTLSCDPTTQLDEALGKSGATDAAMAGVTEMPLTVKGALLSHDHVAGQLVEPSPAAQLPVSCGTAVTDGTVAFHVILIFGWLGMPTQLLRVTLKLATQLFANVGAETNATAIPDSGLLTFQLNPVMPVAPPAI